jgi:hyperosmotically inducible periplasmic protein
MSLYDNMNTAFRTQRLLIVAIFATLGANVFAQTPDTTSASEPAGVSAATVQSTKVADRKLAHRVANGLARARGLNSARILVKARDGVVTLSGSVTDDVQIPLAVEAAKQVEGVRDVVNRIRVSGASF